MPKTIAWSFACVLLITGGLTICWSQASDNALQTPVPDYANLYQQPFAAHWYDGHAELSAYQLIYPRYGQDRQGKAVTIFVTEQHNPNTRVKNNKGVNAIKLNLIEDFQTGVYDYNLMTSVFVPIESRSGVTAGQVSKVSFSSQEWCGQVYQQALFDTQQIRLTSHSYFDHEADQNTTLNKSPNAFSEDALLLWARQLAGPKLQPGQSIQLPLLQSLAVARLQHQLNQIEFATLSRDSTTTRIIVPAGEFEVDVYRADVAGKRLWVYYVEKAMPHRVIQWQRNDGLQAQLIQSKRLKYWQLKANRDEVKLNEIGLKPSYQY